MKVFFRVWRFEMKYPKTPKDLFDDTHFAHEVILEEDKPVKYRNKKAVIDGYTFQSQKEANRYFELKMLQKAGEISGLELQPKFEIAPVTWWNGKKLQARYYIADFQYTENRIIIVEDVKSAITKKNSVYTLKRQLFLSRYGNQCRFVES